VHGVMTYHMALQIGLRHMPSARLALANIGVDKDPNKAANVEEQGTFKKRPFASLRNRCKGRANYYHFNSGRVLELNARLYGEGMIDTDEKTIGALLHTVMDVGVRPMQGPHAGGVNNHADGMLLEDGTRPPWSSVAYDQPWRFRTRYKGEVKQFIHVLSQLRWNKYREQASEAERSRAELEGLMPLVVKDKEAGGEYNRKPPKPLIDTYDQEIRNSFAGHVAEWNAEIAGSGGRYGRSSDEWYPMAVDTDPAPEDLFCASGNSRDCRDWDRWKAKLLGAAIDAETGDGCLIPDDQPQSNIEQGIPW